MANHTKPTKEELEKATEESIQEAEELKDEAPEEPEKVEETPVPDPEPEPQPEPETEPEPEVEEETEEVVTPEETLEEKSKRLEKENKASSREAQKIIAKNRVLTQAVMDTDDIPEPTDEELEKEAGSDNWEVMSNIERGLFRETIVSKRWRARIKEAQDQAKKIEKWQESVQDFINDPKVLAANPELEGKQEEFEKFATLDENNSVPFNLLTAAFLYERSKKKVEHEGKMFETGSGGPNAKAISISGILSVEDGRKLREIDYGKWKELLKAGKIAKE